MSHNCVAIGSLNDIVQDAASEISSLAMLLLVRRRGQARSAFLTSTAVPCLQSLQHFISFVIAHLLSRYIWTKQWHCLPPGYCIKFFSHQKVVATTEGNSKGAATQARQQQYAFRQARDAQDDERGHM